MEEFIAQYGLLIVIGLAALYFLTRGKQHLERVSSDAKDAAIDALLKNVGGEKAEKIEKIAEVVTTIRKISPEKIAKKAVELLEQKIEALPERTIPDPVNTADDVDGLGAALNSAIKAETKREKVKNGLKTVGKFGLAVIKGVL